MLNKSDLLKALPIMEEGRTIRCWQRIDLDLLARWPKYPFPFESLNYRLDSMADGERDRHFQVREMNPDRITLILDTGNDQTIGYCALVEIDWPSSRVGNMAVRLRPDKCGQGLGAWMLRTVSRWCFAQGIVSLRLDVAAANQRAVRCYQKAGYSITGEFWHDDAQLGGVDLSQTRFDFLRPHVRTSGTILQQRFYWMETKSGHV
jgi:RimJ/RimL family protein N-acetyltransferase